jgi:autotransporter-associated beta strand protein
MLQPGSLTVTGTRNYTFGGTGWVAGPTTLVKSGTGTLTVNTTNTYSGGTILSNGTVILGNASVNPIGLGSGPVTFDGGTLEFTGFTGSTTPDYLGNTNALIVPAGQTGTIHVPQRFLTPGLGGTLSGGGTLNLVVNFVRGDISGNWTNFAGKINVLSNGSVTNDFRVVNALGFPNARVNLGNNVLMYSRASAGSVIPIGEFSGSGSGSIIAAGGGTSAGTQNSVTWRVGGLNTDATNAVLIQGTTSLIKEGSGKWTLTASNTYTGTTTVNGGALLINGNQSGSTSSVTVGTAGTLGGSGTIGGNVTVNGTLSPGNSIGTLTFNGNLILSGSGTAFFELTRTPLTNDVARVLGTVTYGGTLSVVNLSPDFLEAGDNFKLFNAAGYSGAFTNLILPDLNDGLAWSTNKLTVDGRLWVVKTTPPVIANTALSGNGKFTFKGSGGTPNWDYFVLTSTNLTLPLSQWIFILTNQFDAGGNFSVTNAINPGLPQQFYLLQTP